MTEATLFDPLKFSQDKEFMSTDSSKRYGDAYSTSNAGADQTRPEQL
jgi:hypothetical protein